MFKRLLAVLCLGPAVFGCMPDASKPQATVELATAVAGTDHLCVIPLPDVDELGQASHGEKKPWHEILRVESFRGSRWPVLFSRDNGAMRFDEQRRLHRVGSSFPSDILRDKFAVERSGRVIGITAMRDRIYVQDPADGKFYPLNTEPVQTIRGASNAVWSDAFDGTLISAANGIHLLRGNRLQLIAGTSGPMPGNLIDLPRYRVVAHQNNHGVTLLYPDGALRGVSGLELRRSTLISRMHEVEGGFLVQASGDTFFVSMLLRGDVAVPDTARRLTSMDSGAIISWHVDASKPFFMYALEAGTGAGRRRMLWYFADEELVRIKDSEDLFSAGRHSIKALKEGPTVIIAGDHIYRHDGARPLKRIEFADGSKAPSWIWVHELQGTGLVVVQARNSLGELVAGDKIVPIPLPPELDGAHIRGILDLPVSRAAVIVSDRGIFAMDSTRTIRPIRGSAVPGLLPLIRYLPGREEVVVFSSKGLYLMLDERKVGPDACKPQ